MKRYIALYILLFISLYHTNGQGVDFTRIEYSVNDPSSEYYYPALFNRYVMQDTTLNDKEYYYLYYGYVTRDTYTPLLANPYRDSLRKVMDNRRIPSTETFFSAIDYAKKVLRTDPFSLREINVLAYAYEKLGDKVAASKEAYKLKMITKVITSTGDGKSEKSPMWITHNTHADDILALRKLSAFKTVALSDKVIYIQAIGENKKHSEVLYFNYSLQYMKEPTYLRDQNGKKINQNKRKIKL